MQNCSAEKTADQTDCSIYPGRTIRDCKWRQSGVPGIELAEPGPRQLDQRHFPRYTPPFFYEYGVAGRIASDTAASGNIQQEAKIIWAQSAKIKDLVQNSINHNLIPQGNFSLWVKLWGSSS